MKVRDLMTEGVTTIENSMTCHDAVQRMMRRGSVTSPAETLERVSADVDLIVLGARGLGAVKRLLLGNVSERLLRHAACPVLIVHTR